MKRIMISVIVLVCLLAAAGGGVYYWNQNSLYITTDNAQVKADIVAISVPATGKLDQWSVKMGDTIQKNAILGKEQATSSEQAAALTSAAKEGASGKPPQTLVYDITSPISGVILKTNVVPGEVVTPGQSIAMVADLSKAYVLAYIDEDQIRDVSIGKEVDVELDAYPDQKFRGKVTEVGNTAGNVLSGSPISANSSNGNYSKEIERVPVKITVDEFTNHNMVLGLNATVKIHK
jgi:multidrug resistance efflux pump